MSNKSSSSSSTSKHRPSYFTPKIKFTAEEDQLLSIVVQRIGTSDWQSVAAHINGRNARQCRERWNNYVNPKISITKPWSPQEDEMLRRKHSELGPKWHTIASFFADRSTNNIKNRFVTLTRRQKRKCRRSVYVRRRKHEEMEQELSSSSSSSDSDTESENHQEINVTTYMNSIIDFNINYEAIKPETEEQQKQQQQNFHMLQPLIFDGNSNENNNNIILKREDDPLSFLDGLKDIDELFWPRNFGNQNWLETSFTSF